MTNKYKIGIYGSGVDEDPKAIEKAKEIGRQLSTYHVIVVTGACSGFPYYGAKASSENGGQTWGFSSSASYELHIQNDPNDDISFYTKLFYIPKNFEFVNTISVCRKYRNVTSTATCDAGIIISGRWGTLNEYTNLMDMGKVIGSLMNSGGIADELVTLTKRINKKTSAILVFDDNPKSLVEKVIHELRKRK